MFWVFYLSGRRRCSGFAVLRGWGGEFRYDVFKKIKINTKIAIDSGDCTAWADNSLERGKMQFSGSKNGKVKNFLRYARNHRIPVHPDTRKIGIACTLIGWACIAFNEANLPSFLRADNSFGLFFNFFVAFFAGTFWLLVASLFAGKDSLKVTETTENHSEDQSQHVMRLAVPERRALIFWRSLIAIVGYVMYSWSKSNTQTIDNSVLFSTDAIMYALIMVFFLKMKVTIWQRIALGVVFLGVCYIGSFDTFSISHMWRSSLSLVVPLLSAAALAIAILMNSVIIQHEPPLRVAFFQCLLGLVCTAIVVGVWMISDPTVIRLIDWGLIVSSFVSGTIYAISLVFFFTAFLYTEPFLIVMLGYSIFPFVTFFSWVVGDTIRLADLVGAALIMLGGLLSVFLQFRSDKERTHANVAGYPIYLSSLKDKFCALRQDFLSGRLGKFEYLTQRHEFNKLLFEYAREIKTTEIAKVEMDKGEVVFTLNQFDIKMLSDGGCRSAPLEILNFCSYEKDESGIVFQMVQDGDLIIDAGANLGWYSIQLAKRFKNAVIHAFEPIPQTFSVLEKNIKLNGLTNVILHNLALGRTSGVEDFFYFRGGSAIASRRNLLEHGKAGKVGCRIATLDSVVDHLQLQRLDFFKCDVEGSELDVITGGLRSLGRFLPVIYIELFHGWCEKFGYIPDDVVTLLGTLGYKCFKIHKKTLAPVGSIKESSNDFNFFFMSPEKHAELIARFDSSMKI